MTGLWNDFNSAQSNGTVIPKGTLAKVSLTIRPGGFDDPSQGWTGGYAKRGATGAVYLDAEYTAVEGAYAKRKIWSLIGLYSPKGPDWGNAGRGLIKGILNSARGIDDPDNLATIRRRRRPNGGSAALPSWTGSSSSPGWTSVPTPMARTRTKSALRSRPATAIMRS